MNNWEFDFGEEAEVKKYDKDWNQFKSEKYIGLVVTDDMEVQGIFKDSEFVFAIAKSQFGKSKDGQWYYINKGIFKENPIFVKHYLTVEAYCGSAEIIIFKSRDERSVEVFQPLKKWIDENPEERIKIKRK